MNNEIRLDEYIKTCTKCKEPLINMGDFWIHPSNKNCPVEDGVRIVIQNKGNFDALQKKYGEPFYSASDIITLLYSEIDLIKMDMKDLIKENEGLKEQLTCVEELTFPQKKTLWKRIIEW